MSIQTDTAPPRSTVPAGFIQRSQPDPEDRDTNFDPSEASAAASHLTIDPRIDPDLHAWLRQYRDQPGQSNSTIAEATGYRSGSTISRYLNGKPEGNVDELQERLRDLRRRLHESAAVAPVATGLVQTSVLGQFARVATAARATGTRAIILGEAGIGKTTAAAAYCAKNPTAVMITLDRHDSDEAGVKRLLWDTVPVRGSGWRSISRWRLILDHYAGSNRLLIVDQAQRLTMGGLELLHDFSDKTGCAQVQIGNPGLVSLIGRDPQIHRRTFALHECALKRPDDAARRIVDLHAPAHAGDALYETAAEWIKKPGSIGLLVNTLRMANDYIRTPEFNGDYIAAFTSARVKSIHEYAPFHSSRREA